MAGDSRYTPLTGVIGEGEEDRPPHPRRDELARLLLERGAEPYDGQVIYNIHFHGKILWWVKLMYEFSVEGGRARRLGRSGMAHARSGRLRLRRALAPAHRRREQRSRTGRVVPGARRQSECRTGTRPAISAAQLVRACRAPRAHGNGRTAGALRRRARRSRAGRRRAVRRRLSAAGSRRGSSRSSRTSRIPAVDEGDLCRRREDRADVVAFLLDLGTPIEVEDAQKQRPLHVAAANDAVDVAAPAHRTRRRDRSLRTELQQHAARFCRLSTNTRA